MTAYFTFFSVAALIYFVFSFPASLSLLLRPKRSTAAFHLGYAFLLLSLMSAAYFISASFYVEATAFHRILTVACSMYGTLHVAQIFFTFPDLIWKRARRILLIVQYIIATALTVYFAVTIHQGGLVYHFEGHYFDFDNEVPNKISSLFILAFGLFFVGVAIVRAVFDKKHRWVTLSVLLGFMSVVIVPAISNAMSRAGTLDRGIHQTIWVMLGVLGTFIVIIMFINYSNEKSSFMTRVAGISSVTILLVLQILGFFAINMYENAYMESRSQLARNVTLDSDLRPEELVYIVEHNPSGGRNTLFLSGAFRTNPPDTLDFGQIYASGDDRRVFREHASGQHSVSFIYMAPNGTTYEVGFNYLSYRFFIHELARIFVYLSLFAVLIIFAGFPIFFLGTLLNPLQRLINATEQVNQNNLDVEIPVTVQDEIGFLSRSFNRMVASIREARKKLQTYADELEDRVQERTAELNESLEKVQTLKSAQDGDYFLTSLLIKPLGTNRVQSDRINVDFVVEQKKKFVFRRWSEEIGGDICIANTVEINGRQHVVFINADAMGKSIQGAGGILVLGAVFESIMQRDVTSVYPERWLKDVFLELHRIFESFDGSMLMSVVLGLVDEQTGLFYYINAEHPETVLYRNGQAEFLSSDDIFRKLGTTGLEGRVYIHTVQLEPGDVIFAGSDGRDDLIVGHDDHGNRVINEDEFQFLRLVEETGGDLDRLYKRVLETGELTDDLSLLRLSYLEDAPVSRESVSVKVKELVDQARDARSREEYQKAFELFEHALALSPGRVEILRNLLNLSIQLKNYASAGNFAEELVFLRPEDSEMFYLAARCFYRSGKPRKALRFSERLRLRNPHDAQNLILLSKIHLRLKDFEKADQFITEVLDNDSNNQKAVEVRKKIDEIKQGSLDN